MELTVPPAIELLFDVKALQTELAEAQSPVMPLKNAVKSIYDTQVQQFQNQHNIVHLIHERAQAINIILTLSLIHI